MFLIWNQCAQTKKIDMKRLILCDILINVVQKHGEIRVRLRTMLKNQPLHLFKEHKSTMVACIKQLRTVGF